jgi:hypothetical protein
MVYDKHHAEIITVTCLEWNPLLKEDRFKDVITASLDFLVGQQRIPSPCWSSSPTRVSSKVARS